MLGCFSWVGLGPLVPVKGTLNASAYHFGQFMLPLSKLKLNFVGTVWAVMFLFQQSEVHKDAR